MFKKIAIMGAGSLGTILGAYIAKAGYDITLIDAYAEHVKVLNEKGAHVVGTIDFTAPVKAVESDKITDKFDLIIYMAKQTYNDTAIPQMVAACDPDAIICCCQNGIPEYAVAEQWPEAQICGAPVGWGATFKGPGESELTSQPDSMSFHLGTLDGKEHAWLADVKTVLEAMCEVHVSDNLPGDRWSKVLINAAWSGMSTVTGGTFGDVMDDERGIKCLAMIAKETIDAATAGGVTVVPFSGIDFTALTRFKNAEDQIKYQEFVRQAFVPHRLLVASMLQDLSKGRKCEIMQIDGVVAQMGDKTGVDTPFTDMVVKIVSEIEAGKRTYTFDNLKDFEPIIAKYSYAK